MSVPGKGVTVPPCRYPSAGGISLVAPGWLCPGVRKQLGCQQKLKLLGDLQVHLAAAAL